MIANSRTDLKIATVNDDDDTKRTTTISYVNPELTDNQAIQLCQKFMAFSTDTFSGVTKVTTEELVQDE